MPTTEERAKTKRIRTNIQRCILDISLATGLIAVSLAAPNVAKHLQPLMKRLNHPDRTQAKVKRAFSRLLSSGDLELITKNGKKFVQITNKGKLKLFKLYAESELQKPLIWDKRWRIVIYDIKESRKVARMKVAELLKGYGFMKLQASVWVYPYPCEELITLLKSELKIGKQLLYMIIEELEYDAPIKKHFKLD